MKYQGKIYRPWMEANSLLIQTTYGCSHNKCTFCSMFDDKTFKVRPIEEVFEDIEEARTLYARIHAIFLIDGNVLVLKTENLLKILQKIKTTIPECKKIAMYAGLNDIQRKSVAELIALKEAGLTIVYAGLESGDRVVLEKIRKNLTPEQAQEGMARAKAAGIEVLLSIILGMGGKERSQEHIRATTELLNILQPEQLAPMTLTIQPGTVLEKEVLSGEFIQATPLQILAEEKYLLENLGNFETFYWGDHANNIVTARGLLPQYRKEFLQHIEDAMQYDPVTKQKIYYTQPW